MTVTLLRVKIPALYKLLFVSSGDLISCRIAGQALCKDKWKVVLNDLPNDLELTTKQMYKALAPDSQPLGADNLININDNNIPLNLINNINPPEDNSDNDS